MGRKQDDERAAGARPDPAEAREADRTAPPRSRAIWLLGLAALVVVLAAGQGWIPRFWVPNIEVPNPQGDELDDPSAKLLEQRRQAVMASPRSAEAWLEYGYALDAVLLVEDASVAYRQASALAPRDPRPRYNLAHTLRVIGELEEAERIYRRLIDRMPNYPPVHLRLGEVLGYGGQTEAAIEAYQQALSLADEYAMADRELGQAYLAAEQVQKAIEHLERAREIQDRDRTTYLALSRAYRIAGDVETAAELADAAAEMEEVMPSRDDFRVPITRLRPAFRFAREEARMAADLGRYGEALDSLLVTVSAWPDEPWVHFALSLAYEEHGRPELAERHKSIAYQLQQTRRMELEQTAP